LQAGQSVAAEISAAGGTAMFIAGDMTLERDVERLLAETQKALGGLDIAHNNVGNMHGQPGFAEITNEEWDYTVNVSMKSTWLCMKHEIPMMITRGGELLLIRHPWPASAILRLQMAHTPPLKLVCQPDGLCRHDLRGAKHPGELHCTGFSQNPSH